MRLIGRRRQVEPATAGPDWKRIRDLCTEAYLSHTHPRSHDENCYRWHAPCLAVMVLAELGGARVEDLRRVEGAKHAEET